MPPTIPANGAGSKQMIRSTKVHRRIATASPGTARKGPPSGGRNDPRVSANCEERGDEAISRTLDNGSLIWFPPIASRCFRCFSQNLSAREASCSAEILDPWPLPRAKNSKAPAVRTLFLAVFVRKISTNHDSRSRNSFEARSLGVGRPLSNGSPIGGNHEPAQYRVGNTEYRLVKCME